MPLGMDRLKVEFHVSRIRTTERSSLTSMSSSGVSIMALKRSLVALIILNLKAWCGHLSISLILHESVTFLNASHMQVERVNQTLNDTLARLSSHDSKNWSSYRQRALKTYNETVHSTTGLPPAVVFYVYFHESPTSIKPDKLNPTLLEYYVKKFVTYESLRIEVTHKIKVELRVSFLILRTNGPYLIA